MKLSIIVPVYNTAGYIDKCVQSLLSQPIPDYEIILVNDGSVDSSLSILQRYLDRYPEKIEIIDTENGGQGRARNLALESAQGEYIGFADSDDWVAPDMFARLLAAAEAENADIAVCDSWCVTGEEQTVQPGRPYDNDLSAAGPVWNKIFRRSLIGNIRFPEGVWYEDFSFSAKLLFLSKKTVFLSEPLYYYQGSHPSTMRNQNADMEFYIINHVLLDAIRRVSMQDSLDKKKVIQALRSYVQEHIPDLNSCKAYRGESRNRRIIMSLNYHGKENISRLILKAKNSL